MRRLVEGPGCLDAQAGCGLEMPCRPWARGLCNTCCATGRWDRGMRHVLCQMVDGTARGPDLGDGKGAVVAGHSEPPPRRSRPPAELTARVSGAVRLPAGSPRRRLPTRLP